MYLSHGMVRRVACSFFLEVSTKVLKQGASKQWGAPLPPWDASAFIYESMLPRLGGLLLAIPPTVGRPGALKVFVDVVHAAPADTTSAHTFKVPGQPRRVRKEMICKLRAHGLVDNNACLGYIISIRTRSVFMIPQLVSHLLPTPPRATWYFEGLCRCCERNVCRHNICKDFQSARSASGGCARR